MLPPSMDELDLDSEMVSIRCPGCGQRFKVGPEFDGKMVECGTCDRRFRVEEDVILRDRKFFPGERKDPSLQRFSRVPLRSGPEPSFDTMEPAPEVDHQAMVEPVSPLRVIFGLVAVVGAVLVALVMMFGGNPGGLINGTPMEKRLVFGGFTALIATALLIYANPTQRLKGILGGLLIAGCLLAIPFFFKQGLPIESAPVDVAGIEPLPDEGDSLVDDSDDAELKQEMGYGKLGDAIASYGADGVSQGKTAVGIWLRDVRLYNKKQIGEYLIRSTGAGERSWMYSRPPSSYLMVLHDVRPELNRIQKLCERFGTVERVLNDMQVIEVVVDNESFVQGPADKLQDPEDPLFYELNRRELESIDLQRAEAAVRRLVSAEPRLYRDDIVKRLHELMREGGLAMKRDVARALMNWAKDGDGSVEVVRDAAAAVLEDGKDVPRSVITFLVEKRDPQSVPMINGLWQADAKEWEALYGDMGSAIEDSVMKSYADLRPEVKISAVRLLGRVGTEKSVSFLENAKQDAPAELAVTIDQALQSIENHGFEDSE